MSLNNMTNSLHDYQSLVISNVCDAPRSSEIIFVQSFLCDFFGGVVSSVFLYQFYNGIEISHPLYAVLFSNILYSTMISFATFGLLLLQFINPATCVIALFITDCLHFMLMMNIITWLVIATLRYHLFVKEDNETIDFPRLRKIALTLTWTTYAGIMSIRISFPILIHLGFTIFPFNAIIMLSILIFLSVSFLVVSYRTDKMLNEKIQNLNNSRNQIHERDDPTDVINSTNEQPSINEGSKSIQILNCKSRKGLQKLEIDFHQNPSFPFEDTAKDYGGIYVGDIEAHESRNSHTHNDSDIKISHITLPNQVLTHTTEYESKSTVVPFETEIEQTQEVSRDFVAESTISNLRASGNKSSRMDPRKAGNAKEELDRIELVSESSKNKSKNSINSEYHLDFLEENPNSDDNSSKLEILYRDSKEHKSIMKTVIVNAICSCLVITWYVIMGVFAFHTNIYLVAVFGALIKFQRTFHTLIASIYCFEVVNHLFKETIRNMRNWLEECFA